MWITGLGGGGGGGGQGNVGKFYGGKKNCFCSIDASFRKQKRISVEIFKELNMTTST